MTEQATAQATEHTIDSVVSALRNNLSFTGYPLVSKQVKYDHQTNELHFKGYIGCSGTANFPEAAALVNPVLNDLGVELFSSGDEILISSYLAEARRALTEEVDLVLHRQYSNNGTIIIDVLHKVGRDEHLGATLEKMGLLATPASQITIYEFKNPTE